MHLTAHMREAKESLEERIDIPVRRKEEKEMKDVLLDGLLLVNRAKKREFELEMNGKFFSCEFEGFKGISESNSEALL